MNTEEQIIKTILQNFKKSDLHLNQFFHSDAEIIRIGDNNYLFTMDSYSDEDHFRTDNPYNLGRNLAVCTISDIFACGGKPLFFANSLTKSDTWSLEYIDLLSKGISDVLKECKVHFIGGDIGSADNWNFTGISIGFADKTVIRKGAKPGDIIYLTGEIGNGNFEAASQLNKISSGMEQLFAKYPVLFPIRIKEAEIISEFAGSCMDTSDGLFKSLRIISEINNTGFEIQDIPYAEPGLILTSNMNLPAEILMLGECGEYELLFTVSPEIEEELLIKAHQNGMMLKKIGLITDSPEQKLIKDGRELILNDFNIYARDFSDHLEYIKSLTNYLIKLMNK